MESQDKNIKKWFENHEVPVDFDQLWGNLEPHVPQKEQRRPFPLVFGLFVALGAFLIIMNVYKKSDIVRIDNSSDKINNATKSLQPAILNPVVNSKIEKMGKSTVLTEVKESIVDTNIKIDRFNDQHSYTKREQVDKLLNNTRLDVHLSHRVNPSEIPSFLEIIKIENHQHLEVIHTIHASSENENLENSNALVHIAPLENRTTNILLSVQDVTIKLAHSTPILRPKAVTKLKPVIFGHLGAGSFALSNEKHGKPLEHLSIGLGSSIKLSDRLSFLTGLNLSRYAMQLQHLQREYKSGVSNGIIETIIDEHGNTQNISGTISSTEITTRNIKWHTFLHVIDLPLLMKYRLFTNEKHSIDIFTGTSLALHTFGQGAYINHENLLIKFDSHTNPYKFQSWSLQTGLYWNWKCFKTSGLKLGVQYNDRDIKFTNLENTSNITLSSYFINFGYFKNL